MSRLNARLQRIEALARASAPGREAILKGYEWLAESEIRDAIRARDVGAPDRADATARWLLEVYEAAPPTPGWTPRPGPDVFGVADTAPRLDPGRVAAANRAWADRVGWPEQDAGDAWLDLLGEDERGRGGPADTP